MGRRRGLFGTILKGMEKASARAAADARRRGRRAESMHARALEREMIREERARERERAQADREVERRRIENEKEAAKRQKRDAKEAERAAWKLELEEHEERERALRDIGNDSPEVEDRDGMYRELLQAQVFTPEVFSRPSLPQETAALIQTESLAELDARGRLFEAHYPGYVRVCLACLTMLLLALIALLVTGPHFITISMVAGTAAALGLVEALRRRAVGLARTAFDAESLRRYESTMQQRLASAEAEHVAAAQERHDEEQRAASMSSASEEAARQRALAAVLAGQVDAMQAVLESVLPLDLPVPCSARVRVLDGEHVEMVLGLPPESVVPAESARLLASGKVSYKQKTKTIVQSEYRRVVAGLALRHASEAMLNLPTCRCVTVRGVVDGIDDSTGRKSVNELMRVVYRFDVLAPMEMDGIDPVESLGHFDHDVSWAQQARRRQRKASA